MRNRHLIPLLLLAVTSAAQADPLKIAGTPVQIAISPFTDRTLRLDIQPLDDQGKPKPTPPSVVLAPQPPAAIPVETIRDLAGSRDFQLGKFSISVKAGPLTITVRRDDPTLGRAKLIQELTIHDADGSIAFHTDAPTFGLGEGRQQFDRRGFFYNFQNGQNVLLATHGGTIPVPFLIGSDGWGMFIHNPPPVGTPQPNTAWGQFDLRGDDLPLPAAPGRRGGGAAGARTGPASGPATTTGARRGGGAPQVNITPPDPRPTRARFIPRQDTLNQAPTSIFIMALDQPSDALAEYTHLVGSPVMPPKWVMGYMQSHRSLAGPDEVLAVAKKFRDDRLPCDALIYLGTGYTNATQGNQPFGGWNMLNGRLDFNPAIFDKPQEILDKLHALNYKIILHKTNAPADLHGDINDPNVPPDDLTHVANYWSKPARDRRGAWADTVTHTSLMNMGIDAWWPDDGDELAIENRLARIQLYYDGSLKDRPNERPWSLDRNGYAGVAKYGGWNWSGDVTSLWATLQAHVPDGVQFSLSCSPWWGTDIGGFVGAPEYSGELYTRWFQFGTFNPLFRSHGRSWHLHTPFGWAPSNIGPGWGDGEYGPRESTLPAAATLNAELHNAAVEPACKAALELRYQLLPYNYTITREACDTGMPLMRALLLSYPKDPTAVSLGDEYLWGPSILVAPVVEKGATSRHLYLPAGLWYDYATGATIQAETVGIITGEITTTTIKTPTGTTTLPPVTTSRTISALGKWIDKPVTLDTIPLYIKAGAIIPMDPIRQYTAEKVTEPTTLHIYPGADGSFTLYDDDGHSQAYLTKADPTTQWIKFTWNDAAKRLTIDPDPRMKVPAGFSRPFKIQLHGPGVPAPITITFTGQHLGVTP